MNINVADSTAVYPKAGATPGLYQAVATANTDTAIPIPENAKSVLLWFETSVSDATVVRGRVAFATSNTAIATLTGTDALMGYHPVGAVEYQFPKTITHLHVAVFTNNNVVRGAWLFR